MKATAIANSNIAFVKYWGKKDNHLNIPMNPSISMTLNKVSTTTTISFSESYMEDEFFLDGQRQEGNKLERVSAFLDIVRFNANKNLKARIVSINSFPTAAGIASSASGFAALAVASSKALGLSLEMRELSGLARQGSGSASRSVYGGFVFWEGEYASQIKDSSYWPELRDIIVIISRGEKEVSSREAMRRTVLKSRHYNQRIKEIPRRIKQVRSAIIQKDFPVLSRAVMEDSDSMHACIRESGIEYLTEDSYKIIKFIKGINKSSYVAAYTFDAGPNPHIIVQERDMEKVLSFINREGYSHIISSPGQGAKIVEEHLF